MTFVESILQKRFIEVKVMFKVIDTVQTYIHKALYETNPTSSHTIQKKQSAHSPHTTFSERPAMFYQNTFLNLVRAWQISYHKQFNEYKALSKTSIHIQSNADVISDHF